MKVIEEIISNFEKNSEQYNTIQYNTIQYNTIQYNTIQFNTIQCNTHTHIDSANLSSIQ